MNNLDVVKLEIHMQYDRYHEIVTCNNLAEVAMSLDDFSTDHCEGVCQMYFHFDGSNKMVPVNIWVEEVMK